MGCFHYPRKSSNMLCVEHDGCTHVWGGLQRYDFWDGLHVVLESGHPISIFGTFLITYELLGIFKGVII